MIRYKSKTPTFKKSTYNYSSHINTSEPKYKTLLSCLLHLGCFLSNSFCLCRWGPLSCVCACATLHSAHHRQQRKFVSACVCKITFFGGCYPNTFGTCFHQKPCIIFLPLENEWTAKASISLHLAQIIPYAILDGKKITITRSIFKLFKHLSFI